MGNLLSKEAILGAEDRRYEIVAVPEWGGDVKLRSLTGAQRDEFEAGSIVQTGNKTRYNTRRLRARMVALCAVDERNQPLFDQGDVMKLSQKSAAALERLFEVCMRLNGLSDDDVKELEEGFGDAQNVSSISG